MKLMGSFFIIHGGKKNLKVIDLAWIYMLCNIILASTILDESFILSICRYFL